MKKEEITPFNVVLDQPDRDNPLSVGNGNLAATVDVLGTQTFYETDAAIPLTVMSSLCFVTDPEFFSLSLPFIKHRIIRLDTVPTNKVKKRLFTICAVIRIGFRFLCMRFTATKKK